MYTIGQVSELCGLPASTLRYYDKEGLFPNLQRDSGIRRFGEQELEALRVIGCLKKTGMPLKDIRTYINMAMLGDETIEPRLKLIYRQREAVRAQMAELQKTLDTLDFKCWYYETAKEAGTTAVPRNMPLEEIPEQYRVARITLRQLPAQGDRRSKETGS